MAYYLVTAAPIPQKVPELKEMLDEDEISPMRPFGTALDHSLKNARLLPSGRAIWEEEDYCSPPLAMERRAVLDTYFTDLEVKKVTEGEGWRQIDHLPSLWKEFDLES